VRARARAVMRSGTRRFKRVTMVGFFVPPSDASSLIDATSTPRGLLRSSCDLSRRDVVGRHARASRAPGCDIPPRPPARPPAGLAIAPGVPARPPAGSISRWIASRASYLARHEAAPVLRVRRAHAGAERLLPHREPGLVEPVEPEGCGRRVI
jgi:hypothetical protein